MSIFQKIDQWLDDSNRRKHMRWLGLEFLGMMIECIMLNVAVWPSAAISYTAVFVTALAIEGKDKQVGNQPDINDIVASMIWPTVFVVVLAVITMIKWMLV